MSQPFDSATIDDDGPHGTTNSGSWIHNFVDGSFTFSDEVYGGIIRSVDFDDTTRLMFTHPDSSLIYTYGYSDSAEVKGIDGDSMNVVWSTGWFDFGHPEQGKFISEIFTHVALSNSYTTPDVSTAFHLNLYKDFASTSFYRDSITIAGIQSSEWKIQNVSMHSQINESAVQWLRIEITGDGHNVMDLRRLALRYSLAGDIVRTNTDVSSP